MTPSPIRCGPLLLEFGARTYVVGIINMAPDSFAGDGLAGDAGAAEALGHKMRAAGADILDVGGRSTRPGAVPVEEVEEARRTIPAVRRFAASGIPVSVDTISAMVAAAALDAGAVMVNDVSGLRDPGMAPLIARAGVPVVVMDWNDRSDAPDVLAGIPEARIIIDPGYGFGLTVPQNMEVLRRLRELTALGRPVFVGTSRKGSIGRVLNLPVDDRLEGTAATVAVAIANGADFVRVHDVGAMARVARMTDAIVRGWPPAAGGVPSP